MKIEFNPVNDLIKSVVPPPRPAREYYPMWYKNMPAFQNNEMKINKENAANKTVKMCMPFADALGSGYIQEAWQDIYINVTINPNGQNDIQWSVPSQPASVSIRDSGPSLDTNNTFYPIEFLFHPVYSPKMPKGWSMLFTHPLNRLDLPFQFTSGIIDCDAMTHSLDNSNFPFYVRNGFSGIIPKGTPMYQMIPIKREDWESSVAEYDHKEQMKILTPITQRFWGGYKKEYWHKKTYK